MTRRGEWTVDTGRGDLEGVRLISQDITAVECLRDRAARGGDLVECDTAITVDEDAEHKATPDTAQLEIFELEATGAHCGFQECNHEFVASRIRPRGLGETGGHGRPPVASAAFTSVLCCCGDPVMGMLLWGHCRGDTAVGTLCSPSERRII
ncbi:unannotated protein [freshwater metagenome]|uniref:Unannotated protein n=1 Tax=freshwater metagenome TaxID=449393 RepID=A0A6J7KP59_9ZZZZ